MAEDKKPKLKFETMYYVASWATEVVEGWGARLEFKQNLMHYTQRVLFYPIGGDGVPWVISEMEVFAAPGAAGVQLAKEKTDLKKHYERTRDKAIEKLKTL